MNVWKDLLLFMKLNVGVENQRLYNCMFYKLQKNPVNGGLIGITIRELL